MTKKAKRIENPLMAMFQYDGSVVCALHPPPDYGYEHYGMLVCDLVRNVADAFQVDDSMVWEWVDKERYQHTTDIEHPTSAHQWMQEFIAKKN